MYEGTTFGSLKYGARFKATKHSYLIFTKISPSMNPHQHNAVSVNIPQTLYDWFDQEETVYNVR